MLKHCLRYICIFALVLNTTLVQAATPSHCMMPHDYQTKIAQQANRAIKYLKTHPATQTEHDRIFLWRKHTKLDAIVFDIDETLLSNWSEIKHNHCQYHPKAWSKWVEQARATGMAPTIKLLHVAQQQGYALVLLTGRKNSHRQATIRNLKRAGITHWNKLIMKENKQKKYTACTYKAQERASMTKHYNVVMNIGDQISDFCGSNNGIIIKLPNPFYTIPTLPSKINEIASNIG
jgi:5'-nucleotidase (lipoprotein e(P4) family)